MRVRGKWWAFLGGVGGVGGVQCHGGEPQLLFGVVGELVESLCLIILFANNASIKSAKAKAEAVIAATDLAKANKETTGVYL